MNRRRDHCTASYIYMRVSKNVRSHYIYIRNGAARIDVKNNVLASSAYLSTRFTNIIKLKFTHLEIQFYPPACAPLSDIVGLAAGFWYVVWYIYTKIDFHIDYQDWDNLFVRARARAWKKQTHTHTCKVNFESVRILPRIKCESQSSLLGNSSIYLSSECSLLCGAATTTTKRERIFICARWLNLITLTHTYFTACAR